MTLKEEVYPIAEGLGPLFPTLIGKGIKYFELTADTNGEHLKSDKPLNVSNFYKNFNFGYSIARMCSQWWTSCW